ncbi:adenylate cyclase type 3 [Trichonephila clavipes]|nr:adenylate cyclase type 3 [Trichonephila clavipes]
MCFLAQRQLKTDFPVPVCYDLDVVDGLLISTPTTVDWSVREKTNTNVDMRVGVHTGAILAGVMGQRQWQFDVYSRDVVLANKMESAGMPGRVHISEKTLGFLNGEFEVTPGDGMSREEALRQAGLETYFITKVLKPYPMGTLDEKAEQNGKSGKEDKDSENSDSEEQCIPVGPDISQSTVCSRGLPGSEPT